MMGIVDTYAKSLYHGLENSRLYALFGRAVIRLLRPTIITLNDNFGETPLAPVVDATKRFLEAQYPKKSPFER